MTHPEESEPIDITPAPGADAAPVAVRRRRTPLVLAGALALALVASVGAFVGYQLMFSGPAPAERMPESVIAYASLDLASSADQTRKLMNIAEKFPQAGKSTDPKEAMRKVLEDLDLNGVDPNQDLASWLGLRVGIAAWSRGKNEVYALLSVQSTDDAAATKGLTHLKEKAKGHLGFVVRDGYALVAVGEKDTQATAEAAAAEASKAPLSKASGYAEARDWLEDDQIAVIYVDLSGVGKLIQSAIPLDMTGDPQFQELMDKQAKEYTGRIIVGVRAEDNGIAARYRSFGSATKLSVIPDALTKLGNMSSGSELAAVAKLPEDLDTSALGTGLLSFPFAIGGATMPPGPGTPTESSLSPAEREELNKLMLKNRTAAEEARFDELFTKDLGVNEIGPGNLSPAEGEEWTKLQEKMFDGKLSAAEQKRLDELDAKMFGPNVTQLDGSPTGASGPSKTDLESMLKLLSGATLQISMRGLEKNPAFAIVAELLKPATDDDVQNLTKITEGELTFKATGNTLTATSKEGPPSGGKLADDPAFKGAFAGAPKELQLAAYLNLTQLISGKNKEELGPLKAIAFAQGSDGGEQAGLIRILIG